MTSDGDGKRMSGGRLYTLDGMRGIAALCVVIYHFDYVGPRYLEAGYLAVDFFFALSGLVVAIAYEDKLRAGRLGIGAFAMLRLVRLYPLYLIGTVAGLLLLAAGVALGPTAALPRNTVAGEVVTALAMLPDPWSPMLLYPVNGPAWSLLYELAVNLAFAVVLARLRTRWLALIWCVALAVYAVKVTHAWERGYGSNLGPYWQHLSAAGPRVVFGFTLG